MLEQNLSQFNKERRKNLRSQLYSTLKEIKFLQQDHLKKNDTTGFFKFKNKYGVLLDIWRRINTKNLNENFIRKYIDMLILLIEDICRTYEGFLIPRDPSGKLINLDVGTMHLLKYHQGLYLGNDSDKSIWDSIIEQRKNGKSIIDKFTNKKTISMNKNQIQNKIHIFLEIKAILLKTKNKTQLRFSLYDKKMDSFITDSFYINNDETSFMFGNNKSSFNAIFTNLNKLKVDTFLVCKIFEILDEKTYIPFATYCISMNPLLELRPGKVYTPSPKISNVYSHLKNSDFIHMHKLILKKDKNLQITKNTKGIFVTLFSFKGDLKEYFKINKIKKQDDYHKIGKFSMEEDKLIHKDKKTDMQITLLNGKFNQESIKYFWNKKVRHLTKNKQKNIRVVVNLLDKDIKKIKNCFSLFPNNNKRYSTHISFEYKNENYPVYNESFYIVAPETVLKNSCLFIRYQHISKKDTKIYFGFSFIHLWKTDGIIPNGSKDLSVYCGSSLKNKFADFSKKENLTKRKESFYITTIYNSSQYSQNETINKILYWRSNEKKIYSILGNFASIPSVFIFKCLKKTIKSLLEILISHLEEKIKIRSFSCLLHIIIEIDKDNEQFLFQNEELENFCKDLHEQNTLFAKKPYIYNVLCDYMNLFVEENIEIEKSIRSISHIVNFILVYEKISGNDKEGLMPQIIRLVTTLLEKKIENSFKVKILEKFENTLKNIIKFLNSEEISEIFYALSECILKLQSDNINVSFFVLVKHIQKETVFLKKEIKETITKLSISILCKNKNSNENIGVKEIKIWIKTVKQILLNIEKEEIGNEKKFIKTDIYQNFLNLFPVLLFYTKQLKDLKFTEKEKNIDKENLKIFQNSITCIWKILPIFYFEDEKFSKLFKNNELINEILTVCIDSYENNPFEDSWIAMKITRANFIAELMIKISDSIKEVIKLEEKEIMSKLISVYMHIVNDNIFKLNCSEFMAEYVYKNSKVEIKEVYKSLVFVIDNLGEEILDYRDYFISQIMKIQKIDSDLVKYLSESIYSLMKFEYEKNRNLTKIESEIINGLYDLTLPKNDLISKIIENLKGKLTDKIENNFKIETEEMLKTISLIKNFAKKLSKETIADECCEYNLLDIFILLFDLLKDRKSENRKAYFYYFDKFISFNCKFTNWVEAGLAKINFIEMSKKSIDYKNMTLQYRKALEYFKKAYEWEKCIDTCDKLEKYYRNEVYDFSSASDILLEKSEYYKNIMKSKKRTFLYYYRVIYKGNFEEQKKKFNWVFASKNFENINQFKNRISKSVRNIVVKLVSDKYEEDLENNKLILLTTLSIPSKIVDYENSKKNTLGLKKVTEYNENNNISLFYYSIAVHKGEGEKNLKTTWTKKVWIKTDKKFPNIYRKARIIETWEEMISPIESATENIILKNNKLSNEINTIRDSEKIISDQLKSLTLELNGTIDAAVSGGTKKYIESFLLSDPKYIDLYPNDRNNVRNFIKSVETQENLLNDGLKILQKNVKGYEELYSHLKNIHDKTVERNQKLFKNVERE